MVLSSFQVAIINPTFAVAAPSPSCRGGALWGLLSFGLALILCFAMPVGQTMVQHWVFQERVRHGWFGAASRRRLSLSVSGHICRTLENRRRLMRRAFPSRWRRDGFERMENRGWTMEASKPDSRIYPPSAILYPQLPIRGGVQPLLPRWLRETVRPRRSISGSYSRSLIHNFRSSPKSASSQE